MHRRSRRVTKTMDGMSLTDQIILNSKAAVPGTVREVAPPIRISESDTNAQEQDRFHRFRLISWWDQAKLSRAKVLVVGAGALGNEIVKNLALLGVGNVLIADMDRIENSNLSRSILYRASDNGQLKADVAARVAREIYPAIKVHPFNGNVVYDLGMGVFR